MHEVAIIGSGLNGLAATYLLGNSGLQVKVFEEFFFGGDYKNDLRTSFISPHSLAIFPDFQHTIIKNSGNMKNVYSFRNLQSPVVELGDGHNSMGYVVDNSLMKSMMIEKIKSFSNVTIAENSPVKSIVNHGGGVAINNENFQIAICCSGANSSIHKMLGLKQIVKPYNQEALVFDITHKNNHQNIALEIFDDCGIIALLPKHNDNSSSVIVSLKNEYSTKLSNEKVLDFLQAKTQRARHIGEIANISTPISRYPLDMKFMKHQLYGSVFFIGDSVHTVHPVLGQGFNMSLKDIEKLTKAIIEGNSLGIPLHQFLHNIPIGNILNHFKMGFATHLFGKTFVSRKRIPYCLTTAAIYAGAMMPSKIKTMLLQKAL